MAVKLNEVAFEHAKQLIRAGRVVLDSRDDWSEAHPSAAMENRFIDEQGFHDYRKWYLGIDTNEDEETKAHYKFPYGDFQSVHRGGVLTVEARAGQYKYKEIELAAAHLHGMLDGLLQQPQPTPV
jgi:hypothetical protein